MKRRKKKDGPLPTRIDAYSPNIPEKGDEISTSPAANGVLVPLYAPAGSLCTPEEVRRNEIGAEDVERMREWCGENEL